MVFWKVLPVSRVRQQLLERSRRPPRRATRLPPLPAAASGGWSLPSSACLGSWRRAWGTRRERRSGQLTRASALGPPATRRRCRCTTIRRRSPLRNCATFFFERTNPTTVNGQGNDFGTQYRTGVYTHTDQQMIEAQAVFTELKGKYSKPIATELKPAQVYWPAEKYHQQYLEKGGRFSSPQSAEKGCTDTIRCYG
mmetsp:Transcript_22658/g.35014  ORF Transcript_22658/g.35014 Transcript_22658/m.35014 type:complete len:196 (-) Transcript_22658:340-927(-)